MSPKGTAPEGDESNVQHRAWIWIRAAAVLASIWLVIQLLYVLKGWLGAILITLLYLIFGSVIAFLAGPIVEFLAKRAHWPRWLAAILVLFCGVGLVALLVYLIVGPLIQEGESLAAQLPRLLGQANHYLSQLRSQLTQRGIPLGSGGSSSSILGGDISIKVVQGFFQGLSAVAFGLVDVVVVLVVAFWLLKDGQQIRAGFLQLLPGRIRSEADFALEGFGVVIGGYVRAQFALAAIVGILGGFGSWLIGVPFPLVVGIAAGVFELIPLVGPFAGGAVAIVLALTKSWQLAVITVGLFLIIHVIEGYFLAPRIQARFVRLHPMVALLSLFAGIEVGGFLGALVAVPVASLLALYLRAAHGEISAGNPDLFRDGAIDGQITRRRRRMLREFRLFNRSRKNS